MSDSNQMAPPLDLDLNSVDTSFPLLKAPQDYEFLIEKSEIKITAAGKRMLSNTYSSLTPATGMKGEQLMPGVHVFDNINLEPSGKSTWAIVTNGVASFIQGVREGFPFKWTPGQENDWCAYLQGKTIKIRVGYEGAGVSKTGKAFREKNVVLSYHKRG